MSVNVCLNVLRQIPKSTFYQVELVLIVVAFTQFITSYRVTTFLSYNFPRLQKVSSIAKTMIILVL